MSRSLPLRGQNLLKNFFLKHHEHVLNFSVIVISCYPGLLYTPVHPKGISKPEEGLILYPCREITDGNQAINMFNCHTINTTNVVIQHKTISAV